MTQSLLMPDQPGTMPNATQLGRYCGFFYAYFTYLYSPLSEERQRQQAEADAVYLVPDHEGHADFVAGWLIGYQECERQHTCNRLYQQQRCHCGHLLRAPVEKKRGYCLECGIVAALVSQEANYALY